MRESVGGTGAGSLRIEHVGLESAEAAVAAPRAGRSEQPCTCPPSMGFAPTSCSAGVRRRPTISLERALGISFLPGPECDLSRVPRPRLDAARPCSCPTTTTATRSQAVRASRRHGAVLPRSGATWSSISSTWDSCPHHRARVLFVIHYFGWPQPVKELLALCEAQGMVLVEDCALSLLSETLGRPLG